jgi:copper(I)-binding protein
LQLLHAKASLYPGTNVTLTFTFANAGTLKLVVPVALQAESSEAVVPGPSATGQEG